MSHFIKLYKKLRDSGVDAEAQMQSLRADGCSKIETIEIFVEHGKMDLGDAKQLVYNSRTWSDTKAADEAFEAAIIRGLQNRNADTAPPSM